MNKYLLTIFLLVVCSSLYAQEVIEEQKKISFDVTIANLCAGYTSYTMLDDLPDVNAFYATARNNFVAGLEVAEFNTTFYNYFGVRVGLLDWKSSSYKSDYIIENAQDYYPNEIIEFPAQNESTNLTYLAANLNQTSMKFGVFGKLELGDKVDVLPFFNYQLIGKNTITLKPNITDTSTNETTSREYIYTENIKYGLNPGVDIRLDIREKIYIGWRLEANFLQADGTIERKDYIKGSIVPVSSFQNYKSATTNYLFGFNVGFRL